MSADRIIMLHPRAQITMRRKLRGSYESPSHPNLETVYSRKISQSPRVNRKRDNSAFDLPRVSDRYAPVPAQNMKTGAQKCVIQRVMKSAAVERERSSGWK